MAGAGGGQLPPALAFLDEHLFTYTSRTCPDPQGAVTLWRAANPAAECECCAAMS